MTVLSEIVFFLFVLFFVNIFFPFKIFLQQHKNTDNTNNKKKIFT